MTTAAMTATIRWSDPARAVGDTLLWLAGANRTVLDQRCPTERRKLVALGGTVLVTAVLAAIAATLTLHSFAHVWLPFAAIAGIGWGFAIMNLDRWFVASARRQDTWWKNILLALPRLALAAIVGFVIAEPLLLGLFNAEVSTQAVKDRQTQLAERRSELDTEYRTLDILKARQHTLEDQLANVTNGAVLQHDPRYQQTRTDLRALEGELAAAQQAVICEKEGTCGSGRVGAGPAYNEKIQLRDELGGEVDAKRADLQAIEGDLLAKEATAAEGLRGERAAELADVRAKVQRLEDAKVSDEQSFATANRSAVGLLDRVEALDHLASENRAMGTWTWMLRLFVLAIDCMPVLVKTMMSLGSASLYDRQLDAYESLLCDTQAITDAKTLEAHRVTAERSLVLAADDEERRRASLARIDEQYHDAQERLNARFIENWERQIGEPAIDRQLEALR